MHTIPVKRARNRRQHTVMPMILLIWKLLQMNSVVKTRVNKQLMMNKISQKATIHLLNLSVYGQPLIRTTPVNVVVSMRICSWSVGQSNNNMTTIAQTALRRTYVIKQMFEAKFFCVLIERQSVFSIGWGSLSFSYVGSLSVTSRTNKNPTNTPMKMTKMIEMTYDACQKMMLQFFSLSHKVVRSIKS